MSILVPRVPGDYPVRLYEHEDGLVPVGREDGCTAATYDALPPLSQDPIGLIQIIETAKRTYPAVTYLEPGRSMPLKVLDRGPQLVVLGNFTIAHLYGSLSRLLTAGYAEEVIEGPEDKHPLYRKADDVPGASVRAPSHLPEVQVALRGLRPQFG